MKQEEREVIVAARDRWQAEAKEQDERHRDGGSGTWQKAYAAQSILDALDRARGEEADIGALTRVEDFNREQADKIAREAEAKAEARVREIADEQIAKDNIPTADDAHAFQRTELRWRGVERRLSVIESRLCVGENGATEKGAGVWCETCKAWYPPGSAHAWNTGGRQRTPAPRAVAEEGETAEKNATGRVDAWAWNQKPRGNDTEINGDRELLIQSIAGRIRAAESAAAERGRRELIDEIREVDRQTKNTEEFYGKLTRLLTPNPAGVPEG